MKSKFFMLFCAAFMSIAAVPQTKITADKVPAAVMSAFKAKFPTAQKVKWERENKDEYEAVFVSGATEMSARFDKNAKWLETETEMKASDLPAAAQNTLKTQFAGYKIDEVSKVEDLKGSSYEAQVKKGDEVADVVLNDKGEVISKTIEKKSGKEKGKDEEKDKD